jgi:hypothetical protein
VPNKGRDDSISMVMALFLSKDTMKPSSWRRYSNNQSSLALQLKGF